MYACALSLFLSLFVYGAFSSREKLRRCAQTLAESRTERNSQFSLQFLLNICIVSSPVIIILCDLSNHHTSLPPAAPRVTFFSAAIGICITGTKRSSRGGGQTGNFVLVWVFLSLLFRTHFPLFSLFSPGSTRGGLTLKGLWQSADRPQNAGSFFFVCCARARARARACDTLVGCLKREDDGSK